MDATGGPASALPSEPEIYESVLDLIGNTPIVRLPKLNRGVRPTVAAKLEMLNPGDSLRTASASP